MQAELHLAHRDLHVGNLACAGCVDGGVGKSEVHVIEHVEGVGTQFEKPSVKGQQILRERKV